MSDVTRMATVHCFEAAATTAVAFFYSSLTSLAVVVLRVTNCLIVWNLFQNSEMRIVLFHIVHCFDGYMFKKMFLSSSD